jgi:Glyoxalase/Bleomycin resistance protein/Dioxygenase superfamily
MRGYHYISKDLCDAGDGASGLGSERKRAYNAPDVGVVDFTSEGQMMLDKIQHIGYLVADLDKAVVWFERGFGAANAGGDASRRGGRSAFLNFGQVQVQLIEPQDPSTMGAHHVMDQVGYVTQDIVACISDCCCRGFRFVADAPNTNAISQQELYFDTATSMGSRMHLTQLPA